MRATGDRAWSRPCGQLPYLGSVGKSIHPGSPRHSPSTWHTLAVPQTRPPRPDPTAGAPAASSIALGGCGWCGLSSGEAHEQKQQTQRSHAALFCTWKQLVAITAGRVLAYEPRQGLSRAGARQRWELASASSLP